MNVRFFLFLLIVLASGCVDRSQVTVQFFRSEQALSPVLTMEIAATPADRARGLMYRKSLPANTGMLFLFPTSRPLSFWMKDTYVELDIIFLDESFRVESISKRAAPLTGTPRKSGAAVRYVVEVEGGSADSWGVAAGDLLRVDGELPVPH